MERVCERYENKAWDLGSCYSMFVLFCIIPPETFSQPRLKNNFEPVDSNRPNGTFQETGEERRERKKKRRERNASIFLFIPIVPVPRSREDKEAN